MPKPESYDLSSQFKKSNICLLIGVTLRRAGTGGFEGVISLMVQSRS